jgi:AAA domain
MKAVEDSTGLRESICRQVSTAQLARRYTDLEPFGRDGWFYGTCPVNDHGDEKRFYIGPVGGWHCYECGRGGDVVELEFLCGGHGDLSGAMSALALEYAIELLNGHAAPAGILLEDVQPERVEWEWPGRIPFGKLTLVDGDPGTGKSAAVEDVAARVSAGKCLPDGTPCEAAGVVICSAEDGFADTIRPRFDAAGGDPSRAVALSTVPDSEGSERQLSIPEDLDVIERAIARVGAKFVVVDPLMAFLAGEVNSHRDQDIRRALAPLARLAERTGAAIVVVRHLNKASGGNVLYRGGGSIGIIGAARSGLLIAKHPEDAGRRVLASVKSNLAPPAPSLVFSLTEADNGAVRVEWKGESSLDAAALLSAPTDHEERSTFVEAQDFLRVVLADGRVPAREVQEEARTAGISERTLKRAKQALGVEVGREGEAGKRGGGTWYWSLPTIKGPHSKVGPLNLTRTVPIVRIPLT